MNLQEKIDEIKTDNSKEFTVTPRELINHLGYQKRSWRNCDTILRFLNKNELELSRNLYTGWIDAPMVLRHKTVATTKVQQDAVRRVGSMQAANHKPLFIDRHEPLAKAITLMLQFDYSQLPVISGGERTLAGVISWKSIGLAQWKGVKGTTVADYMCDQVTYIKYDKSLLNAIRIVSEKEFVVILNDDKTMNGIITTADVASEFFTITQAEAFLLLEQIELQIRNLISRGNILLEDLQKFSMEEGRDIQCIDDLTFGEYIRVMENDKQWKKIGLNIDKTVFVNRCNEVRDIRNDVMHFEPDGISEERMTTLRNMARFLTEIM